MSTGRRLIVEQWISLDGYVSDRNGSLDFFVGKVRDAYANDDQLDFLKTIDCILFGQKTYTLFAALWPLRSTENDPLALAINTLEKVVFSHTLKGAAWGKWLPGHVEKDLLATVGKLKASPGGNLVAWGSTSIVQALMKQNMVDEFRLHVCPTLLGGGSRLFPESINPDALALTTTCQNPNGTVLLHYTIKPHH